MLYHSTVNYLLYYFDRCIKIISMWAYENEQGREDNLVL